MADEPSDLKFKNVVVNHSNENEKDDANDPELPLEKLKLGPKRKLLVLCLGGLLVNRVHIKHWTRVQGLNPDLRTGNFVVFKRPFCTEFIKFCFERFEVGIWSATVESNTEAILNCVTGSEMKKKLAFVWGQEECIDSGIRCLRKRLKPLFLKDLRQLWDKKYLDLPWRKGQYSWSNTLLICVDPPTSILNPDVDTCPEILKQWTCVSITSTPNTGIFPQPYKRHDSKDIFLGPSGELQGYLERLVYIDNVPSYVKEHPFGQPAITPSHPDWNYYAKIVREFGEKDGKSTR